MREVSPVRIEKQAREFLPVGERDGDVDLLASQSVRARQEWDHADGKCRLARREVEDDVLVAAFLALVNA